MFVSELSFVYFEPLLYPLQKKRLPVGVVVRER